MRILPENPLYADLSVFRDLEIEISKTGKADKITEAHREVPADRIDHVGFAACRHISGVPKLCVNDMDRN